jgi:hypothetical protein
MIPESRVEGFDFELNLYLVSYASQIRQFVNDRRPGA